ncbi:hypothetical protein E2C01_000984 [Portunus trituberculatus]|uniref:Uncharacterized protein n=1 Tax=Portunus trituberculatus TaxID=210409 RepID=A0A5B7CG23_PORTR|nr:hypothetical protein [Portunus trituberculatus]
MFGLRGFSTHLLGRCMCILAPGHVHHTPPSVPTLLIALQPCCAVPTVLFRAHGRRRQSVSQPVSQIVSKKINQPDSQSVNQIVSQPVSW